MFVYCRCIARQLQGFFLSPHLVKRSLLQCLSNMASRVWILHLLLTVSMCVCVACLLCVCVYMRVYMRVRARMCCACVCVRVCCVSPQAVADAPVVRALSHVSLPDTAVGPTTTTNDPLKDLLERFVELEGDKGGRGGAEALFVLQVGNQGACEFVFFVYWWVVGATRGDEGNRGGGESWCAVGI